VDTPLYRGNTLHGEKKRTANGKERGKKIFLIFPQGETTAVLRRGPKTVTAGKGRNNSSSTKKKQGRGIGASPEEIRGSIKSQARGGATPHEEGPSQKGRDIQKTMRERGRWKPNVIQWGARESLSNIAPQWGAHVNWRVTRRQRKGEKRESLKEKACEKKKISVSIKGRGKRLPASVTLKGVAPASLPQHGSGKKRLEQRGKEKGHGNPRISLKYTFGRAYSNRKKDVASLGKSHSPR